MTQPRVGSRRSATIAALMVGAVALVLLAQVIRWPAAALWLGAVALLAVATTVAAAPRSVRRAGRRPGSRT